LAFKNASARDRIAFTSIAGAWPRATSACSWSPFYLTHISQVQEGKAFDTLSLIWGHYGYFATLGGRWQEWVDCQ